MTPRTNKYKESKLDRSEGLLLAAYDLVRDLEKVHTVRIRYVTEPLRDRVRTWEIRLAALCSRPPGEVKRAPEIFGMTYPSSTVESYPAALYRAAIMLERQLNDRDLAERAEQARNPLGS
jgi:hypothetical protein